MESIQRSAAETTYPAFIEREYFNVQDILHIELYVRMHSSILDQHDVLLVNFNPVMKNENSVMKHRKTKLQKVSLKS